MLDKMIDKIKRDFLQKGGIKEQMYRARTSSKYYQSNHTYQSYQSNPTPHSSAEPLITLMPLISDGSPAGRYL